MALLKQALDCTSSSVCQNWPLITTSYSFRYVVVIPYRPDMHKPPTFYLLVYPSDRVSEAVTSISVHENPKQKVWAGEERLTSVERSLSRVDQIGMSDTKHLGGEMDGL
jgi:hypothetical protein